MTYKPKNFSSVLYPYLLSVLFCVWVIHRISQIWEIFSSFMFNFVDVWYRLGRRRKRTETPKEKKKKKLNKQKGKVLVTKSWVTDPLKIITSSIVEPVVKSPSKGTESYDYPRDETLRYGESCRGSSRE